MSLRLSSSLLRASVRSPLIRTLATAAPPTPPPTPTPAASSTSSASSSSFTAKLPPAIRDALRTNPVLVKLVSDPECQAAMKSIGEQMYKSTQNGKTPSPMDIMTNSELRKAVGAFTQSMTRLEVSMDELKPIMTSLMATGGLDGFAPNSSSSDQLSPNTKAGAEPTSDIVRDALKKRADAMRASVGEKVEGVKETVEEVKEEVVGEAKKEGGGLMSKLMGGWGKK